MKKTLSYLLIFSMCLFQLHAQEADDDDEDDDDFEKPAVTEQTGKAAKHGTVNGTAMSMAIWGILLTVVIAATAAAIPSSHSHS